MTVYVIQDDDGVTRFAADLFDLPLFRDDVDVMTLEKVGSGSVQEG